LGVEQTCTDLSEALRDPELAAVSLCTPHPLHCPQAVAAAEAGKHVLVEKPMAMTVAEATCMLEAASANGVQVYVAESATYTPMARYLRQVVETGEPTGELTAASVTSGFRGPDYGYPGRRAWLGEPSQGGTGTWMLHGIHTVGQLRYVLGEVRAVYATEHKASSFQRRELEGTMSLQLTLESGITASVLQTAESKLYGDLQGYVLHGDRGSLRATAEGARPYTDEEDGTWVSYPESAMSSFALELEAFSDHVSGVAEGPTTGVSERRSLAIVEAGYESARTGQPVDLRERFGEL
ncbi:Gfo/Idh/MocA family protein, partial [Candidatus Latescibacterota bacterium]